MCRVLKIGESGYYRWLINRNKPTKQQLQVADNAALPIYNKYYKRYAARVKVRQIKEADFKKWKFQALVKRDECTNGIITVEEFAEWLEGSFPNRGRK